jgi:hypothetical protein
MCTGFAGTALALVDAEELAPDVAAPVLTCPFAPVLVTVFVGVTLPEEQALTSAATPAVTTRAMRVDRAR